MFAPNIQRIDFQPSERKTSEGESRVFAAKKSRRPMEEGTKGNESERGNPSSCSTLIDLHSRITNDW